MQEPRYRHLQHPGTGASVLTIALTAIAFWLSYEHLAEVAAGHGLEGVRGWAWPATVDLFIVIGELLFLQASLQHKVDPFAIFMTASGSLGSVALNVAGVGEGASRMDYVVAAVPPVAALIAFAALMRQVHAALKSQASAEVVDQPLQEEVPALEEAVEAPLEEAGGLPEWVEEALVTPTIDQEALVEKLVANGEPLPGRKTVADQYGVSDWIARQALQEAKKRLLETDQLATTAKEN